MIQHHYPQAYSKDQHAEMHRIRIESSRNELIFHRSVLAAKISKILLLTSAFHELGKTGFIEKAESTIFVRAGNEPEGSEISDF